MTRTLAVTLAALALAAACSRPGKSSQPPPAASAPAAESEPPTTVRFAEPRKVRYAPRLVVTGTLRARQSAPLAFAAGGPIARIAVRRGQEVATGQLLGALEDVIAAAQRRQAESALAAATVQLALAEDALQRVKTIRAQDGVSEAQAFQAQSQRDLAASQVAAAEAQLQQATGNLDHHYLRAPFAGVVTRVPEGVGITVGPGVPVFALASTRSLYLDTSVPQDRSGELRSGERVTVTVPATGARTAEATVQVIVAAVDAASSRVPVEIAVPNGDGRFLANAYARAELARGRERDAYQVPAAALLQRDGAYAVWTAAADGRAVPLPVQLLGEEEDAAFVAPAEGDWSPGARAILAPSTGLAEGARVAEVDR